MFVDAQVPAGYDPGMKIAVLGPGAIGSTFAFQLARAGHEVTLVARGSRLEELKREAAVVKTSGERAPVEVWASLDPSAAFDLVLVTVLAPQVAATLPALSASSARKVMFMFNTFDSIAPLREAVGAERFAFGFPGGVFCLLKEGRIEPTIRRGTTVSDAEIAELFSAAEIPTVVDDDMQSWLRSHAAMVYPLMAIGVRAVARAGGISWREAGLHADAFAAGMRIVRETGSDVRPGGLVAALRTPRFVMAGLMWLMSRTKTLRDLGKLGEAEPRMLADMMSAAAPRLAAPIEAVRP